jgi:hypothetical protein
VAALVGVLAVVLLDVEVATVVVDHDMQIDPARVAVLVLLSAVARCPDRANRARRLTSMCNNAPGCAHS